MPTVNPAAHVAAIARQYPSTIKVFQRHRIDFCCGGKRPLAAACSALDLPQDAVLAEVQAAADGPQPAGDWVAAPLPELMAHIVERYHVMLRRDLPVLRELADKVARRHGADTPALLAVHEVVEELAAEMTSHMAKEEMVLFPLILRLASDGPAAVPMPLAAPIVAMEHEHEEVAGQLRLLRELTRGYTLPEGACNSFRGFYQMLAELEADTEAHVHLENNVLFARAAELAGAAVGAAAG